MKIVRIFASDNLEEKGGLLAIQFNKGQKNEYERNFDFWFNAEEVLKYLAKNEWYLRDDFFTKQFKSNDEIQEKIEKDAYDLEDFFLELNDAGFQNSENILEHIFKPLNNKDTYGTELQKSKSTEKDERRKPLIRLYAIRIHKNLFIITGGAIKLEEFMDNHDDTKEELKKIERVRTFLKNNGITTAEDIIYYYENNE